MSVAQGCIRLARGIKDRTADMLSGTMENLGDLRLIGRHVFTKAGDFIAKTGPVGEEISRQLTGTVRRAKRRAAIQQQDLRDALKGVSKEDRIQIGLYLGGRKAPKLTKEARATAETIRKILDRDLGAAQFLGFKRTMPSGKKAPVQGSGEPFPQVPNAKGQKILDLAHRRGLASGRVKATAEQMVKEGRAPDEATALEMLRMLRDQRMRATNPYLERSRIKLPEWMVEWDPKRVLDGLVERNAYTLEGARQWGVQFEGLNKLLAQLDLETGKAQTRIIEDHIKIGFGVQSHVPKYHQRIASGLSNYQTNSKLSGIFSPLLNFGQRFVNTADAPILVQLRALKDLPPGIASWFKAGRQIQRTVEQSGAISGRSPLAELAQQSRVGQAISKTVLAPFFSVARGNEFHSAWVARLALESDIEQLIRLQGRESTLGKMWDSLRNLAVDPQAAVERRLARTGLDPDELVRKVKAGERFTPDEFAQVMQQAAENDQFSLNLITQGIWWNSHPWMRLAFKFKTFGVRQTEFIYRRVAKEAMLGNFAPMVKFLGATLLLGEAYHIARDLVEGRERSALMKFMNQDPNNRDLGQVATRVIGSIAAQGGFGLLADLEWGVGSWVAGPAGSTVGNVRDAAMHINQDPSQVGTALKDLLREEIVPIRQSRGLIEQVEERLGRENARFIEYHRLRSASFEFRDAKDRPDVAARVTASIDRALSGSPRFPTSPRSLRYRYAADAITANEVDEAAEYLQGVFETANTPREVADLARGARSSMRARSPLGNLNEADRAAFLRLLPPDQRRSAQTLRRRWMADYEKAILQAARNAQRTVRERE